MEQSTCDAAASPDAAPVKPCECGCGQPAPIAKVTRTERGQVKGQPIRFIWGHGRRKPGRKSPGSNAVVFLEVGQRFGRGVALDPELRVPNNSPTGSVRGARLLCDCGEEYVATISSLIRGTTKSCGCLKRETARRKGDGKGRPVIDRAGQRYGTLTAVRYMDTVNGVARWMCRCDCGQEVIRGKLHGDSHCRSTCPLISREKRPAPAGKRAPGEASRLHVLRQYRNNAKRNGRAWELSNEDFDRLTSSDCYYCGAPPSRVFTTGTYEGAAFVYNGIDRKDNRLGYVPGNVLPCCSTCNIAKRDLPYDDFLAWIARLTEYHFFHPDMMPSLLLRKAQQAS